VVVWTFAIRDRIDESDGVIVVGERYVRVRRLRESPSGGSNSSRFGSAAGEALRRAAISAASAPASGIVLRGMV
jgi:hypothetical protein